MPCTAAYRLFAEEGLSVDVASGGELHMALRAGFDPDRIHMHGNNKSDEEILFAARSGIRHLILDSFDEIERCERLLDSPQRVLIRVTPGIKPSTHDYVQTGQLDSKFGFGLEDGLAARAIERVLASDKLELVGLHAHIGSQIFELEPYTLAIRALGELAGDWCRVVNVGGGLGVAYTAEDEPPSIDDYVDVKVRGVAEVFGEGVRILVEPGRSLVANAGVTAYRVGTVKEIPGVRTYVAVDGGMSDNLRPMLYGSRYEALIADRAAAAPETLVTIAGMHCESGDILVRDATLAEPAVGDVLVTPGDRRLRLRDGEQLQRRAAAAGRLLPRRRGARRGPPRDLRGPDRARCLSAAPKPVRIGLLGRGTVGAAFAELLAERADAVEAATGRRPELSGVLTRSEGDFGAILERSDLIVELMGGIDPARELRARRAARRPAGGHRQQAAARPARRRALRVAREAGVQLRFEAAVAAVIPIVRTIQESFGVTEIAKVFGIVNGTTNFILSEMAASGAGYERGAGAGAGARLRRGRPDRRRQRRRRGGEDGDPRPPRLPHPGRRSPRSPTRGSRRSSPTTSPTPRSSASR